MWALNLVRNNKGEEEAEVKDMSNKEEETKEEEKNTSFNLENIKNLINEESNDTGSSDLVYDQEEAKECLAELEVLTCDGKISEYLGANVTSSKVSASLMGSIILYIRFLKK